MSNYTPNPWSTDDVITEAKLDRLESGVADHTHGVADLSATGTRSSSTFLRGDDTWATPPTGDGGGQQTVVDIRDFGAANDAGTTDNSVAINAAVAAAAPGSGIHIPPGRDWHCASRIDVTKMLTFFGHGAGNSDFAATRLVFPPGVGGFRFDLPGGRYGFRDITLHSSATSNTGAHGIHAIRGVGDLAQVTIERFGGHGLFLDSTNTARPVALPNVNHTMGISVRAYENFGDGIRLEGVDTHRCTFLAADVVANRGWGINNMGHKNSFYSPHADQQYYGSPGAYRDDALSGLWLHCYAENLGIFLIDTNSRSGELSDGIFGLMTLTYNGGGYTTWDIRRDGVRNALRIQGIEADINSMFEWNTSITGVGSLDLHNRTTGQKVMTVNANGTVHFPQGIA